MTNPFRGELQVKLGAKSYKTRLTVDSCMRIESAVGISLVKIAYKLADGELTLTQIISVLTPALRGGGLNVTNDEVAKMVYEAGYAEGLKVVGELISNILQGHQTDDDTGDAEKKEEPTLLAS